MHPKRHTVGEPAPDEHLARVREERQQRGREKAQARDLEIISLARKFKIPETDNAVSEAIASDASVEEVRDRWKLREDILALAQEQEIPPDEDVISQAIASCESLEGARQLFINWEFHRYDGSEANWKKYSYIRAEFSGDIETYRRYSDAIRRDGVMGRK